MSFTFSRPDYLPFPHVWKKFKGKRPMDNGKIPTFVIQDLTEDLEDAVVEHMITFFLRDEPLNAYMKVWADHVSISERKEIYRQVMKQRISLVALVDDEEINLKPKLVGVHLLSVQTKGEKDFGFSKFRGECLKKSFTALQYATSQVNVYEKYGTDKILVERGLSVDRDFRRQGVGLELLKAKCDIARAIGINVAPMVCTAIESQTIAETAGYELLAEIPYDTYKVNGEIVFNIPNVPSMKYYALKID